MRIVRLLDGGDRPVCPHKTSREGRGPGQEWASQGQKESDNRFVNGQGAPNQQGEEGMLTLEHHQPLSVHIGAMHLIPHPWEPSAQSMQPGHVEEDAEEAMIGECPPGVSPSYFDDEEDEDEEAAESCNCDWKGDASRAHAHRPPYACLGGWFLAIKFFVGCSAKIESHSKHPPTSRRAAAPRCPPPPAARALVGSLPLVCTNGGAASCPAWGAARTLPVP